MLEGAWGALREGFRNGRTHTCRTPHFIILAADVRVSFSIFFPVNVACFSDMISNVVPVDTTDQCSVSQSNKDQLPTPSRLQGNTSIPSKPKPIGAYFKNLIKQGCAVIMQQDVQDCIWKGVDLQTHTNWALRSTAHSLLSRTNATEVGGKKQCFKAKPTLNLSPPPCFCPSIFPSNGN